MAFDQATLISLATFNGYAPKAGSKCVPVNLDFTTVATDQVIDFEILHQLDRLEWVQAVFIDNYDAGQILKLTVQQSGHRIVCPPSRQGFFPLLAPDDAKFIASTGGVKNVNPVQIQFLNFPVPACVWG